MIGDIAFPSEQAGWQDDHRHDVRTGGTRMSAADIHFVIGGTT